MSAAQIQALTIEKIRAFTVDQLQSFTTTQIQVFSAEQIAALTSNKTNLFSKNSWASSFLGALNQAQIQAIAPNLFSVSIWGSEYLPDTFYKSLTVAQIGKFSSDSILYWGVKQFSVLSPEQISAFTVAQISFLKAAQIQALVIKQILALTKVQISALTPSQCRVLTTGQLQAFTVDQLQSFTTTQIQVFSAEQIAALTSNKTNLFSKNSWASSFLGALNQAQIQAIAPNLFSVSIWGSEYLPDTFYKSLTVAQIGKFSSDSILYWGVKQFSVLSPEQISAFTVAQISFLKAAQIQALPLIQTQALTIGQIRAFTEAQIQALSPEQITALTGNKSNLFSENGWASSFLGALNKAQIQAIPPKLFSVPIWGSEYLPETFYKALTAAQIREFGFGSTVYWGAKQISLLSPEQISAFTITQIAQLNLNQLRSLSASQIQALTATQVQTLSKGQIQAITEYQVSALTVQQIRALSRNQVHSFSIAQVKAMSRDQISALTESKADLFNDSWAAGILGNLSTAQIQAIDSDAFSVFIPNSQFISQNFYSALTPVQISKLDAGNLNQWGIKQFSLLSPAQINALNINQVRRALSEHLLSASQFGSIPADVLVTYFTEAPLVYDLRKFWIDAINFQRFERLTEAEISGLTAEQFKHLLDIKPQIVLACINNRNPDLYSVGGWSDQQLAALSASVINSLDQDLAKFSPKSINVIGIDKFTAQTLAYLTPDQIRNLSTQQISRLNDLQIKSLLAAPQLARVMTQVGSDGQWSKSQFAALPANLIGKILEWTRGSGAPLSAAAISTLSVEQVARLTIDDFRAMSGTVFAELLDIHAHAYRYVGGESNNGANAWNWEKLAAIPSAVALNLPIAFYGALGENCRSEFLLRTFVQMRMKKDANFSVGLVSSLQNGDESYLNDLMRSSSYFGARHVAAIAPSLISSLKSGTTAQMVANLKPSQLKYISIPQLRAIQSNPNIRIVKGSALEGSLNELSPSVDSASTLLSDPSMKILADTATNLNNRNAYVFTTLTRAVLGSGSLYSAADVNLALAQYIRKQTFMSAVGDARTSLQKYRSYGSFMSWGTAASYMRIAQMQDDRAIQAQYGMQGVSFFLSSLKPLSGMLQMFKSNGIMESLRAINGGGINLYLIDQDADINNKSVQSKNPLTAEEFNSLKDSGKAYYVYDVTPKKSPSAATTLYIQELSGTGVGVELSDYNVSMRSKTELALGVVAGDWNGSQSGAKVMPSEIKSTMEGGILHARAENRFKNTQTVKTGREVVKVQLLADGFSLITGIYGLSQIEQDGSSKAIQANVLATLGITASVLNIFADWFGPSTGASAASKKRATDAFAAANILNDIASLTVASIQADEIRRKGANATDGEKIAAYGGVSSVAFLTALGMVTLIQPQFAPVVFLAAVLMPNFSAIGSAEDIKDSMDRLRSQGQYVYANVILEEIRKISILNSTPIINWFSAAYTPAIMKSLSKKMQENNHSLVWKAIEELHYYRQVNSDEGKLMVSAYKKAIEIANNAWSAVVINVQTAQTIQYYADNNRILSYATQLNVNANSVSLTVHNASENGVMLNEVDQEIKISFNSSDTKKAINGIILGNLNASLSVDVSEFVDSAKIAKLNTFEIKKNNVSITLNQASKIYLDLSFITNIDSIDYYGSAIASDSTSLPSVELMDSLNTLSSLEINLDHFDYGNNRYLAVRGLMSGNFENTIVHGTQAYQQYSYAGGVDQVTMLGGHGLVSIGGGGSELKMGGGSNKALIELVAAESMRASKYDGGISVAGVSDNIIDFTGTYNDLIFIGSREVKGVDSWVKAYAFESDNNPNRFYSDIKSGLYKNAINGGAAGKSIVDRGDFTNFDVFHTGYSNNYLQIEGNTDIKHLHLDGNGSNVLDLDVDSIKHSAQKNSLTTDPAIHVYSSINGSSEINLGANKIGAVDIVGGGGDLIVNVGQFDGQLTLDLRNAGHHKTIINDAVASNTKTIEATIEKGGASSFDFNLGGAGATKIDLKNPTESLVQVRQLSVMEDQSSLSISMEFTFDEIEFGWDRSNNAIFGRNSNTQRQFLSVEFGYSQNEDNIGFATKSKGATSALFRLDNLIQTLTTLSDQFANSSNSASMNIGVSLKSGNVNFYKGGDIAPLIFHV